MHTICQVRAIIGRSQMHLDVIQILALTQIIVIRRCEQTRSVPSHYGLQIPAIHIEIQRFESIHRHLGKDLTTHKPLLLNLNTVLTEFRPLCKLRKNLAMMIRRLPHATQCET